MLEYITDDKFLLMVLLEKILMKKSLVKKILMKKISVYFFDVSNEKKLLYSQKCFIKLS